MRKREMEAVIARQREAAERDHASHEAAMEIVSARSNRYRALWEQALDEGDTQAYARLLAKHKRAVEVHDRTVANLWERLGELREAIAQRDTLKDVHESTRRTLETVIAQRNTYRRDGDFQQRLAAARGIDLERIAEMFKRPLLVEHMPLTTLTVIKGVLDSPTPAE